MKIQRSTGSPDIGSTSQKQVEEQKKTQAGNTKDTFESSSQLNFRTKEEQLPGKNESIGGGHTSAQTPGGGQTDGSVKSESSPKTPSWVQQDNRTGISWSHEVRPITHSTTSAGTKDAAGSAPKTVGLDYFDKNKQMMDRIVSDKNDVKNLGSDNSTPGRTNPFSSGVAPGRGFGKNHISNREKISGEPAPGSPDEVIRDSAGTVVGTRGFLEAAGKAQNDPYDGMTKEEKELSDTSNDDPFKGMSKEEVDAYLKDNEDFRNAHVKSEQEAEQIRIQQEKELREQQEQATVTGTTTPAPDAVDDSHVPDAIKGASGERAYQGGTDQVTLTDENKRQQEKVVVEREAVFGSMVGRITDGRSTPAPSDGTTDAPGGPSDPNTTGGVDLNVIHRKGDPGDGDEE